MRLRISHTFVLLLTIAAVSSRTAQAQNADQPKATAENVNSGNWALSGTYG